MDLFTQQKDVDKSIKGFDELKAFITTEWFNILSIQEKIEAVRIIEKVRSRNHTPSIYNAFEMFRRIKPSEIKVVICSICPYPDGQGNGVAFECMYNLSPTLKAIYESISDFYNCPIESTPLSLKWLTSQGVALFNMRLTVEKGDANSHKDMGWHEWMLGVMKKAVRYNRNVVYALWGNEPKAFYRKKLTALKPGCILDAHHPVSAERNHTLWLTDNFKEINDCLQSNNQTPIDWTKGIKLPDSSILSNTF